MSKRIILSLILASLYLPTPAAANTTALILAGDSWAFLPCIFGSAARAFKKHKIKVSLPNCHLTSKSGLRANNFKESKAYKELLKTLKRHKEARAVYLSIGGNDFLRYWHKNMSPDEEHLFFSEIRSGIVDLITVIHNTRPDIKILLAGYEYARFTNNHPIKAYADVYRRMGKPTSAELHNAFLRFSKLMVGLVSDRVSFIHYYGLMHFHYGVPELNIKPGQTTPPELISPPNNPTGFGGIAEFRNPKNAMLRVESVVTDAFHLNPDSYEKLFEHAINNYLGEWLAD